jgi:hypothetical protein
METKQPPNNNLTSIKHTLEKEGEEKVKTIIENNGKMDDIIKVMSDGVKEFTQKTGRNITYSELRELYG